MTSDGPPAFDTSVANQARIYDYLLGGKDNYAADRTAAEAALKIYPEWAFTARANRAFLGRVVRYLTAEAGIRQFLDIGTGIPTAGNTHQVAQEIAPETRVVYVDYDPISRDEVARFFEGMDLVAPGLVRVEEWRTEPGTDETGESPSGAR